MESRIQYATCRDGVSVAFSVSGEGEPLLHLLPIGASTLDDTRLPAIQYDMYSQIAGRRQLIRYDPRGTGLSDRDVEPPDLDAFVSDVEAIVDRLGLEQVDLFGVMSGGIVALAFAMKHPGRVRRIATWCVAPDGVRQMSGPRQALDMLAQEDWQTYAATMANIAFGWADVEQGQRLASILRETTTSAMRNQVMETLSAVDLTPRLDEVQAPVLVMHMRRYPFVPESAARRLAASLPDAELIFFEGDSLYPRPTEVHRVLDALDTFLGGHGGFADDARREAPPPACPVPGALRTILFTDLEGFTSLTGQAGDDASRDVLRHHERITRRALIDHGGCEVKVLSDGFLATFDSASRALDCAVTLQESFESYARLLPHRIRIRIGLNAGEPISEDDDVFGTAVTMAARIADMASGGEVLVSDVVRLLAAGKGYCFGDRGRLPVRGYEDPERVWELRWREPASRPAPESPLDHWRRAYFGGA